MAQSVSVAIVTVVALLSAVLTLAQGPGPWYNVRFDPNTLTISGVSAGAAFATQFELAYGNSVHGVGIIAGLPYNCSLGSVAYALTCMSSPFLVSLSTLMANAQVAAANGLLDPLTSVQNHSVLLFSGTKDTVVNPGTMGLVQQMYQQLNAGGLTSIFNYSAEHAWITDTWGNACDYLGAPYINKCGLDYAGSFFQQAFGFMGQKFHSERGAYNSSHMYTFDMSPYGASADFSLDTIAYLYIPAGCASGVRVCHLHVNFHGCKQQRTHLPDPLEYVSHTGLNEWAETNNIVIFYPQTIASEPFPFNPEGCFDWWGYTGSNFAVKSGPQMKIFHKVINTFLRNNPGKP